MTFSISRPTHFDKQIAAFRSLKGKRIIACMVMEMAFREIGPDGQPQFSDPSIPFVQAWDLYLTLESGRIGFVHTWQDGDIWALAYDEIKSIPATTTAEGLFRWRSMTDKLAGLIIRVDFVTNGQGGIRELTCMTSQGRRVILAAGEAYEQWNGSLKVHPDDECVLIFESEESARQWL